MMNFKNEPNCASTDAEIFFPVNKGGYEHITQLKQICGACHAQAECLEYALQNAVLGYWGNTTEAERQRLRKKLKITATPILVEEVA